MSGEKKFSFTPILSYPALQGAGAGSPCRLTYVPSRHFPSTTERNKPAGETHTVRPVVFNEKDPVMHRDCPLDCKVYVGNLGNNGNKTELERSFGYYGPLRSVWVARNPPGFAFVEFEDPRDATDAVRELDGRTLCGCRVRVELSNGEKRSRTRGAPPPWSRRARDRDDYRRRSPPPRRRSPRRRSFSRSRSRSFSRDRRRERSLSRDRNHKPSRSFSRSRSRSRSNDRK